MTSHDVHKLIDILNKQRWHSLIQKACAGTIIIGECLYVRGLIPRLFVSRPKLLSGIMLFFLAGKGVAAFLFQSYLQRKFPNTRTARINALVSTLKRDYKFLFCLVVAAISVLQQRFINHQSKQLHVNATTFSFMKRKFAELFRRDKSSINGSFFDFLMEHFNMFGGSRTVFLLTVALLLGYEAYENNSSSNQILKHLSTLPPLKDTGVQTSSTLPPLKDTGVQTSSTLPPLKDTGVQTSSTLLPLKDTGVQTSMPPLKDTGVQTSVNQNGSDSCSFP